jgi:hypothetical protein
MTNSGSGGLAGGFGRGSFEHAFHRSRPLFGDDDAEAELAELERLIAKFPTEARRFLDGPHDSPDGSGSPP